MLILVVWNVSMNVLNAERCFTKNPDECPYCSRKRGGKISLKGETEKSYAKNQSSVEHKGHKS